MPSPPSDSPALVAAVVLAHLLATGAYAGFQATVRLVVYPQMALVDAAAFPRYEAAHQRRVSLVVGPLFAAVAVTTAGLLAVRPGPLSLGCAACFAVVLAVTAFGAVPQHRRLSAGFDPAAHRRLVLWDGVRLAAALGHAGCALALALVTLGAPG